MLKQMLKQSIQYFAARFGAHTHSHAEPQLLILMYHRVLPETDARTGLEEPGMTVSPETFRMNLRLLANYFEFVSLADWLEKKNSGLPLPEKACAITFDDGWADNYEYAFPILHEANIPATIFTVSSMIGTQKMFWPERLARILTAIAIKQPSSWQSPCLEWLRSARTDFTFTHIAPSREQISQIIAHAKQYTDQENHLRLDLIEDTLNLNTQPQQGSLLSWAQLKEMTDSGSIDTGSHTCNHIRLNAHTPNHVCENEILHSKQQIETHTKQPVKTFCFPNGDHSSFALALVRQAYIGAVTTEHGWNTASSDSCLLRRIGIHDDIARDRTAFLARISGWL